MIIPLTDLTTFQKDVCVLTGIPEHDLSDSTIKRPIMDYRIFMLSKANFSRAFTSFLASIYMTLDQSSLLVCATVARDGKPSGTLSASGSAMPCAAHGGGRAAGPIRRKIERERWESGSKVPDSGGDSGGSGVTVIGSHTVKQTERKSRAGWADPDDLEDLKKGSYQGLVPISPIASHHSSIRNPQANLRQFQDPRMLALMIICILLAQAPFHVRSSGIHGIDLDPDPIWNQPPRLKLRARRSVRLPATPGTTHAKKDVLPVQWLEAREKSTAMQSSGNFVSSSTWWSRYWMEPEAGDHAVLKRRHPFASEQVPSV
ncbi:hypothetical protein MJO28_009299 [Puccinia striiformis f. sp. tritici]|uniref:Uncharacterized protein n=1 Tax=Puccinia striiformis f. sp. tritici TaxID=168172 RepID=A0ACC0E782_9BASI|nr:hypothetical protein MJO28_009299 [Puccinia striiformis f. sp. tritici]